MRSSSAASIPKYGLQKPIGRRCSRTWKRAHTDSRVGPPSPSRLSTACETPSGATNERPAPSRSARSSASSELSVTRRPPESRAVTCSGIEAGCAPTLPAIEAKPSLVIAPRTWPPDEASL